MFASSIISSHKDIIISLLLETKRKGIENVIQYLEESGFFDAPSSICRHHNWRGGLAEHCLGVYKIASELNNELPHENLVIAGILHDICKASKLYYDSDGIIHRRHTHIKGHGRCSIRLLEKCGLSLTEDERLAIEVERARQNPLWKAIHKADQLDASGKYYKKDGD